MGKKIRVHQSSNVYPDLNASFTLDSWAAFDRYCRDLTWQRGWTRYHAQTVMLRDLPPAPNKLRRHKFYSATENGTFVIDLSADLDESHGNCKWCETRAAKENAS